MRRMYSEEEVKKLIEENGEKTYIHYLYIEGVESIDEFNSETYITFISNKKDFLKNVDSNAIFVNGTMSILEDPSDPTARIITDVNICAIDTLATSELDLNFITSGTLTNLQVAPTAINYKIKSLDNKVIKEKTIN